jgi:hypothetical protein
MALIPLNLPAGVYRNGTEYQQSNRWRDANLVRWEDNSLRPIGGWRERIETAFSGVVRGMLSWTDNGGDKWIAAGTHDALFVTNENNSVTDITPTALTTGSVDASQNTGFGGGFYGTSYFGVPRPEEGAYGEATTWSLDTWGEYLVACNPSDGVLYEWDLDTSGVADPISNAPTDNLGLMVTEERFLFALGAGGNPRKVQWSDREDNTNWTPAATNEAGSLTLQTQGELMAGIRMQGRALLLTDTDAHAATYVGPPYVYGIERVGTNCGLIARKALASVDNIVYWMGVDGFFAFDGTKVVELKCDVSDYVFDSINRVQKSKIYAMPNSGHDEIWWFYPDEAANDNTRYVAFNYKENHWLIGSVSRSAGIDRGVYPYPMATDTSGNLYEHEVGLNVDGATVFAETGPLSLGAGDQVMIASKLIPDEQTQGDTIARFKTRFHPNDVEREYGSYTMSTPTSVRFTGRQVRMRIEGDRLAKWRVGTMRLDVTPRGTR